MLQNKFKTEQVTLSLRRSQRLSGSKVCLKGRMLSREEALLLEATGTSCEVPGGMERLIHYNEYRENIKNVQNEVNTSMFTNQDASVIRSGDVLNMARYLARAGEAQQGGAGEVSHTYIGPSASTSNLRKS